MAPCVVVTPSMMFSYSGTLEDRRRPKPMPWERNSWRSKTYTWKQRVKLGRRPRSGGKWMPSRILSAMRERCRRSKMPTSTFRSSSWCLFGSNRFVDTKPCNSVRPEPWTSTYNGPHVWLERLQSQSQLPDASTHLSASCSLLRNERAQSPSPRSASGEQRCRLHSPPVLCWSGFPTELPVIWELPIQGTPKPLWWKTSWCYHHWLQSITQQYARRNAPPGNVQCHAGVYQA